MLFNPKGKDGDDRVGSIIRSAQGAFTGGIVQVPLLLAIDRTTPPHQMITSIVLERAGDASPELTGRVAPTIIAARVVHRALARAGRRGGRLRQIAQLMGMGTITIKVLFLGATSVITAKLYYLKASLLRNPNNQECTLIRNCTRLSIIPWSRQMIAEP